MILIHVHAVIWVMTPTKPSQNGNTISNFVTKRANEQIFGHKTYLNIGTRVLGRPDTNYVIVLVGTHTYY